MFSKAIFPQKFKPGQLVVTSLAPPRWDGEHPRGWGTAPEGTLAVITSDPREHYHTWGGLYDVVYVSGEYTGTINQICGDFLRERR